MQRSQAKYKQRSEENMEKKKTAMEEMRCLAEKTRVLKMELQEARERCGHLEEDDGMGEEEECTVEQWRHRLERHCWAKMG